MSSPVADTTNTQLWNDKWSQITSGDKWKSGEKFGDYRVAFDTLTDLKLFTGSTPANILVPLSGDSPFVAHAASKGQDVTAIELSQVAVNLLLETTKSLNDSGTVTIIQGDIFVELDKLSLSSLFDVVYDKDAFGCISPENRSVYAEKLSRVLRSGGYLYLEGKRLDDHLIPATKAPYNLSNELIVSSFPHFNIVMPEFVLPFDIHPNRKQVRWILRKK